mmetsp:Transcript_46916/g.69412  ORF Transcript_46916/g.69412 Transcript_46916/m.69412 type:complete len:203 (+) Transcript_46916:999-1607(+)
MVHGNVVNQLHDHNSLTNTGSTEETNLSSLRVRRKQIYNFDSSYKNILCLSLLGKGRGRSVKRSKFLTSLFGEDRSLLIDWLTNHIDNSSQSLGSDRNLNGGTGISALLSTDKTVGTLHSNSADCVFSQMLGDLKNKTVVSLGHLNLKCIEDLGKFLVELHIHHGSNDLGNLTSAHGRGRAAEATLGPKLGDTSCSNHRLVS